MNSLTKLKQMDHNVVVEDDGEHTVIYIRNNIFSVDLKLKTSHKYDEDDFKKALSSVDIEPSEVLIKYLSLIQTLWLKPENDESFSSLAQTLPGYNMIVTHPINGTKIILGEVIISLNDRHEWSFDQIADWVESLDEIPTFDLPPEVKEVEDFSITVLASSKAILP